MELIEIKEYMRTIVPSRSDVHACDTIYIVVLQ